VDHTTNVLFDSTILLGARLADEPLRTQCRAALALAESGAVRGHVSDCAVAELAEELLRAAGVDATRRELAALRAHVEVIPSEDAVLDACMQDVLAVGELYYEDVVTMLAATENRMELIVTLNAADFGAATTTRVTPPIELLSEMQGLAGAA